jgi:hypothetical protein
MKYRDSGRSIFFRECTLRDFIEKENAWRNLSCDEKLVYHQKRSAKTPGGTYSPFTIYRDERRGMIKRLHKGASPQEINEIIHKEFSELSEDQKKYYRQVASDYKNDVTMFVRDSPAMEEKQKIKRQKQSAEATETPVLVKPVFAVIKQSSSGLPPVVLSILNYKSSRKSFEAQFGITNESQLEQILGQVCFYVHQSPSFAADITFLFSGHAGACPAFVPSFTTYNTIGSNPESAKATYGELMCHLGLN